MKKLAVSVLLGVFGLLVAACVAAPVDSDPAGEAEHTGEAAAAAHGCGKGIQSCNANQVGQPCNPNNLNVLCSAQTNGAYCCLAYAP
jgi:hypothetical protein